MCFVANVVDPKRGSRSVRAIMRVVEHFDVYNYYCRSRTEIGFLKTLSPFVIGYLQPGIEHRQHYGRLNSIIVLDRVHEIDSVCKTDTRTVAMTETTEPGQIVHILFRSTRLIFSRFTVETNYECNVRIWSRNTE